MLNTKPCRVSIKKANYTKGGLGFIKKCDTANFFLNFC